jgi:uncharacterized protein (TIGR00369 family)
MKTLGACIDILAPGRLVLEMAHAPHLTQQHGFLHAGMLAAALDSACGSAAYSQMPQDAGVPTVEFKLNLLAPGRRAEVQADRPGPQGRAYDHGCGGRGLGDPGSRDPQADRNDDRNADDRARPRRHPGMTQEQARRTTPW